MESTQQDNYQHTNPPAEELLLPEPKHHFSILLVISIIFSALLIIWVLYTLILKNKEEDKTIPIPVVTRTPKQRVGISQDWKTYQSNSGYSISYPSSWRTHIENWQENDKFFTLDSDDELVISFTEPNSTASSELKGALIRIKKAKNNSNNESIHQWYKNNFPFLSFIQSEDIMVDDVSSLKVVSILDKRIVNIFIPGNSLVFQITYEPLTNQSDSTSYDYESILDQILSTFKFNGL